MEQEKPTPERDIADEARKLGAWMDSDPARDTPLKRRAWKVTLEDLARRITKGGNAA